jgi:putative membrane protein
MDRWVFGGVLGLSAAVILFLIWLIYIKDSPEEGGASLESLPAVNASLNSLCAICLVAGFVAIRRGAWRAHMGFMLSALLFSGLFLVSYVAYHHLHGDTRYEGVGVLRAVYFAVLISHIVCTAVMLPMILMTVFFAATRRFDRHRRLARFTLPLWLYASITGVVIFLMLKSG